MAIATPESYADMLDRAKAGKYAIPAINVTSSQTLSAALKGFADAESDGIVQVSNGGAAYWSGSSRADRVKGSLALSAYAYSVADLYPGVVALHTDHCPRKLVDTWLKPLLEIEIEQARRGEPTAFQSHMWDGSAETLKDNIEIAVELLAMSKKANTILEIEIGAVGGEEDGIKGEENANLYTTADDAWAAVEALGLGENGRYTTALTFGNVHGAYNGVIKMNVDTDTQYAFTRPVADHMLKQYDGVLKIDGEVGNKKAYDPRAWGKAAENGMAARVVEACERLGSVGSAKR